MGTYDILDPKLKEFSKVTNSKIKGQICEEEVG